MIVVNIFNGMETELNSNEGPVSENLKIFRHFYYAKMCSLLFRSGLTKEEVNELTKPDFICTYLDVKDNGFAELHFERNVPAAVCAPVTKEEPKTEVTEEPKQEEKVETQEEVKTEFAPEAPAKRGRGRPKKTVA